MYLVRWRSLRLVAYIIVEIKTSFIFQDPSYSGGETSKRDASKKRSQEVLKRGTEVSS